MDRREFLIGAAAIPLLSTGDTQAGCSGQPTPAVEGSAQTISRVRPGDAAWPSQATWEKLRQDVRRAFDRGEVAAGRVPDRAAECGLHRVVQGTEKSLLHRRPAGADANVRLARCLDVGAQRLCGRGRGDGGHRCGGEFRPRAPSAIGSERGRAQLPGDLERG